MKNNINKEDEKLQKSKEEIESEKKTEEEIENEASQEKEEETQIQTLQEELECLNDKYLRANAEFENIKKRHEKEKYQAINYAHEQFARDLLPIIDALENALVSVPENEETSTNEAIKKYKEGIELTIEQFYKCFEKHGIKPASNEGEFDPNIHEALMRIESDEVESGHIVQTLQKGYTIKDRVLRPAMVSIAK